MKRSKFSDEQILAIFKEGQAGRKVADLVRARDHGADVLPLAGEVRRAGAQRVAADQAARGREPSAETHRGRADAGYPGVESGGGKEW